MSLTNRIVKKFLNRAEKRSLVKGDDTRNALAGTHLLSGRFVSRKFVEGLLSETSGGQPRRKHIYPKP